MSRQLQKVAASGNETSNLNDRDGTAAPALSWAWTGEPDDQLWTELRVVAPLASNTTVTGISQLRLSETLSNPIFIALGADVNYRNDEDGVAGLPTPG